MEGAFTDIYSIKQGGSADWIQFIRVMFGFSLMKIMQQEELEVADAAKHQWFCTCWPLMLFPWIEPLTHCEEAGC